MSKCILCGHEMKGRPMYGDNAHNALETCVANLRADLAEARAEIARLTPAQGTEGQAGVRGKQ